MRRCERYTVYRRIYRAVSSNTRRPGMLFKSCTEVERRCIRLACHAAGTQRESWPEPSRGPPACPAVGPRPVRPKSCCAKRPVARLSLGLRERESLVRRTQLTGSLAGSPHCETHLSLLWPRSQEKAKNRHPNKGRGVGGANWLVPISKGVSVPDGWPRLRCEVHITPRIAR